MSQKKLIDLIEHYNAGRDPELLQRKYEAMQANAFAFLRGTAHLFYADLPRSDLFLNAPSVWICGDLHLENFGCYLNENRLGYFDITDFDEAVLAPCTWELLRFLTSLLVGAKTEDLAEHEALSLCRRYLAAYCDTLRKGKAVWIERATAGGMIKELLTNLKRRERDRRKFLDERTVYKNNRRVIRIKNGKALKVSAQQRKIIATFMRGFAKQQEAPKFFALLDSARRIAGLSSLGLDRYALLIEGYGSPQRNYLLDMKKARPSALLPYLPVSPPQWSNDAERVVTIQQWCLATTPAFLQAVVMDGEAYVLKELQPGTDRIELRASRGKFRRLQNAIGTMAKISAWGQLRSHSRRGSASPEELSEYARLSHWQEELLEIARIYRERVEKQWREFHETLAQLQK